MAQIYRLRGTEDSAAIKGWTEESGEKGGGKEGCWQREEALLVVIMKDDSRSG